MTGQTFCLLIMAAGPAVGFLWISHQRLGIEIPANQLAGAFVSGASTAVLAGIAERVVSYAIGIDRWTTFSSFAIAFVLVAFTEELVKCVAIGTYVDRLGENPTIRSTLLVGMAVACVFAVAENIVYVFNNTRYGFAVSIYRHLTAVPLHILNGLVFATYLGLRILRPDPLAPAKAFAMVWIIHGFYDFVIFERQMNLFLLLLIFAAQFAYIRYGLREARAAANGTAGTARP